MADITDASLPDSEKIFISPEHIAEAQAVLNKKIAKQYLIDTDWYVTRKAETGKSIPSDILTKRAQARIDASD